jgi:hypothetical protein
MQYKIVKDVITNTFKTIEANKKTQDKPLLIFEADNSAQAQFITNKYLQQTPYNTFGMYWIANVGHKLLIAGKQRSKCNYEVRTLIVQAPTKAKAIKKFEADCKAYSKPYKNVYGQPVQWLYSELIDVREMDFFDATALFSGKVVEVFDKRISKKIN